MAQIYGQLVKAALEVSASDLSGTITGLMSWNSTSGQMKVSDGTDVRAMLRNDLKAIIGNNGTANNNIRFHRGASTVLQFLQGGDATAEGTLSTNLAQTSGRVENYANASLPAVGNAGRIAWVTDLLTLKVDNGAAWLTIGDVVGPASSTDNALARFDSTTGKIIQNSGATLDDSNILTTAGLLLTGLTASRALQTDASKNLESSTVTTTELGYLSGVTSAIQTQLNATPTIQKFLSGSGTYTTPAGVKWIRVRMVGGGGGGGGSGSAGGGTGGAGGNTTFGTTLLVANGGGAGAWFSTGGVGGTASLGIGPIGVALTGQYGHGATVIVSASEVQIAGGIGGSSPYFGGGGAEGRYNSAGQAGITNTGGGGQGGGSNFAGSIAGPGSGGGSGGFVEAIINAPSATYAYAVGAAGTAGAAGTNGVAGGVGAAGAIIVEEYYLG